MSKDKWAVARLPVGIIGLCLTIIAMLWTVLIFDADRLERAAIEKGRSDASNLAMAFRENVQRTVSAIDQLLLTIIAENNEIGNQYRIPTWVENSPLLNGLSVQVAISGPDGVTVASTLGVTGRNDISDRQPFRYHVNPSAPQPYISQPMIGQHSGRWSIQITRRISRNDGSFGGVIVASIDPMYFSRFFDEVDLGQNGVVDLIGLDGVVRARRTLNSHQIGQNVGDTALFKRMLDSSSGSEIARSKLDGITRIFGYSSVPEYPLVVTVGLAMDDVLAAANHQRTSNFAIGGFLTTVIITLSWFLAHETRRRRQRELTAHAEEKVREQKVLLDTALNNMHHGLVMFDKDKRALVINQTYTDMYRLSRETAKPGCTMHELLEQRTASGTFTGDIDDYIENAILRDSMFDRFFDLPGGRSIRVVNRIMDGGGWVSTHEDVTQRQKVEQALLESEQMARAIIDTALDAFLQLDPSGTIVGWSPKAEEMFGWSQQEIVGRKLRDLIIPVENREAYSERIAQFLRGAHAGILGRRYEAPSLRRDGTPFSTEVSLTALRRRDDYIINCFIRDITDKLAAEERFRQAQKMESVGQLTGGIAHDFNNMLTVITGTIDILADAIADKPQLAAIAKLISEAADRGAELTGHLLAFARKQPLQPRETDINALMVESGKLLHSTLGEHIEIETAMADDAWPALVDSSQLSSALMNLAINARDAMPSGGKLTLETSNVVLDQRYAKTDADVQPGYYVLIAVSDTGSGIPEAIRDKIFEPFFTTKGVGRGTGLGLSMVYGFVKQSGGHIKVYSEEGHGTTFKIYLPRAGAQAAPKAGTSSASQIEGGTETILIVEDDALVRSSVTTQIQSLGYHTLSAANAAEALALADGGAQFDLLFTDVIMPGKMNGRQLAEEMAKRRSPLKVLFTSGYAEDAVTHHGRLDPGVLLLGKPYRKLDLAHMLRRALGDAETLPPRIHEPRKRQAI
jgi:PAS domain S-box-containing protein